MALRLLLCACVCVVEQANFVSGGMNGQDANKYIACQGPLPNTMFDYW